MHRPKFTYFHRPKLFFRKITKNSSELTIMEGLQRELERVKEVLKKHPYGITIIDMARELGINRNTAARYLDVLYISGQADMQIFGPAKVYTLSHRVPASALLNFASDHIFVVDRSLRIVQINNNLVSLMGIKRDDIIGKVFNSGNHPLALSGPLLKNIERAVNGEYASFEISYEISSKRYDFAVKTIPTAFDTGEAGVTIILEDITDQKRMEREINQMLERLRELESMVNRSPVIVFLWRIAEDWPVEFVTENVTQLGYTANEFMSGEVSWPRITHPEDHPRLVREVKEYLESGQREFTQSYRLLTKSGEILYVEDKSQVVYDDDDNPTHVQGLVYDISDRMRAVHALRESEEKYRTLVESTLQGIIVVQDNEVVYVNDAYAEITGRTVEQLIGLDGEDMWELVHPDDRAALQKRNRRRENGEDVDPDFQYRYVMPDGTIRYAHSYATLIEYGGRPANQILVIDVTKQHEIEQALIASEEKYRKLVEKSLQGIVLMQDETVVYVNQTVADIFGTDRDELNGLTYEEAAPLLHPDDLEMIAERWDTTRTSVDFKPRFVFRIIRQSDGMIRRVESYVSTIELDGKPAIQIAMMDITDKGS